MIDCLMMGMCWRHAFLVFVFASIAICSLSVPYVTGDIDDVLLGEPSPSLVSPTIRPQAALPVPQSQPDVPQTVPRPDAPQPVPQPVPQSPIDVQQAPPRPVRLSRLQVPTPASRPARQAVSQAQLASSSSPSSPKGSKEVAVRETIYGKVRGDVKEILPGKFLEYYLGVPYAAPPVGELRLENPVSPVKWSDIRNCTTYPPGCLQAGIYVNDHRPNFTNFREDCLYLNIYLPRTDSKELRPVFAYIHGGSNLAGMAAMFDGDVFAVSTDVVVVMLNYRLANFGFISMASPEFAGNYGLWDQVFALKWIQNNIKYFGGDPAKVTLSGHSAGAADVSLHVLSEHARGLFRYAICHSGTSLAPWSILSSNDDPTKYVRKIADEFFCNHPQITDLKNCLKKQDARHISKIGLYSTQIRPTYSPAHYGYLKAEPEVLLQSAPINAKAIMIGVTSGEGSHIRKRMRYVSLNEIGNFLKSYSTDLKQLPIIEDLIIQEYIPWDRINPTTGKSRTIAYAKFMGDYDLTYPSVKMTELLAERLFPVHLYSFEHLSMANTEECLGVPHGEDMFYMFGVPLVGHPLRKYTELDKEVSKKYMALFGNFVKTGKAVVDSDQFFTYVPKGRHYIKIFSENNSAVLEQSRNLLPRRMEFWRRLIPTVKTKLLSQQLRKIQYEKKLYFHRVLSSAFGVLSVLLICLTTFLLCRLRRRMTSLQEMKTNPETVSYCLELQTK